MKSKLIRLQLSVGMTIIFSMPLLWVTTTSNYTHLVQRIISGSKNCFFGEAYNVSFTDVYDFTSEKMSLKKYEIALGIHHQELGLPWDQPVPEEQVG